jgi:hypothetical protein
LPFAVEGAAFVAVAPSPETAFEEAALMLSRTALLLGACFLSLLIARQAAGRGSR